MNAILDDLTPAQREAAIQSGPVLVIAGAGTGKTKTLTAAVAHRIADCGIPANRVLAVTFTNKAAAEMTGRIRVALGDGAAPHWTGTFHGLGARHRSRVRGSCFGRAAPIERSWIIAYPRDTRALILWQNSPRFSDLPVAADDSQC